MERAKKKLEEEVLRMHERVDELKESPVMRELNEIFQQGLKLISPEEMTGALRGKFSILQQMETMFKNASQRIDIVTTPEGMNELLNNHLEVLKKAKERGVEIKIATNSIEKCADAVKALGNTAEIRTVDEKELPLQGRFFVVDGKQLVFGLTDSKVHSTQDIVLWSKSEHAAGDVLEPLFKLVWTHSKPVS